VSSDNKDIQTEILSLRSSLIDANTHLPAYPVCFEELKQMTQNRFLGLVFLQISDMDRVEAIFGFQRYEDVLRRASLQISAINQGQFGGALLPTQRGVYDDQFCVFVPYEILAASPLPSLEDIAEKLYRTLEQELSIPEEQGLYLNMGYAILHYNPFLRFERLVHRVVEEAASVAQRQEETEHVLHELELRQILSRRDLSTVFHPIVSLQDFSAIGYEALTRGPAGTPYESPEALFACARQSKLSRELDRQCKLTAISSAGEKPTGARLFINTLPTTLDDPEFLGDRAVALLGKYGIEPEEVIWELTERHAIEDYESFASVMKAFTTLGYGVAIDDVGTGYSSIQTITHVRPRYLKVDRSLVTDIESNLLKQELVSSLLVLGKNINAQIVAEGIQTNQELKMLQAMGVPYGQGYLFGMPARAFPPVAEPIT
jgi:EAL domain-containing protein (putative c-di-GMP-specific phosphodiesterase class I)